MPLSNSSLQERTLVFLHPHTPFPPSFEGCAGVKWSGWEMVSWVFKYLYPPLPNIHLPSKRLSGGKRWSLPSLVSCNISSTSLQKWGISLAWLLGTFVGRRASKREGVLLERNENEPWEGEGKRRGGCMLPSPTSPQMEGGAAMREGVYCCSASE